MIQQMKAKKPGECDALMTQEGKLHAPVRTHLGVDRNRGMSVGRRAGK